MCVCLWRACVHGMCVCVCVCMACVCMVACVCVCVCGGGGESHITRRRPLMKYYCISTMLPNGIHWLLYISIKTSGDCYTKYSYYSNTRFILVLWHLSMQLVRNGYQGIKASVGMQGCSH